MHMYVCACAPHTHSNKLIYGSVKEERKALICVSVHLSSSRPWVCFITTHTKYHKEEQLCRRGWSLLGTIASWGPAEAHSQLGERTCRVMGKWFSWCPNTKLGQKQKDRSSVLHHCYPDTFNLTCSLFAWFTPPKPSLAFWLLLCTPFTPPLLTIQCE